VGATPRLKRRFGTSTRRAEKSSFPWCTSREKPRWTLVLPW
jgi:hypothetical protein